MTGQSLLDTEELTMMRDVLFCMSISIVLACEDIHLGQRKRDNSNRGTLTKVNFTEPSKFLKYRNMHHGLMQSMVWGKKKK